MEGAEQALLCLAVEVDEDVAADDEIEASACGRRRFAQEIAPLEAHELANRRHALANGAVAEK